MKDFYQRLRFQANFQRNPAAVATDITGQMTPVEGIYYNSALITINLH